MDKMTEVIVSSPEYHSVHYDIVDDDCARICIMDRNCLGYKFDSSVCYTFNESSFIFTPEINCMEFNPTTCDVTDCLCHGNVCEIDACDLSGKIANCTFSNCDDSTLCEPFANSTCALEITLVYINCSSINTTVCTEATTLAPWSFKYTQITGTTSLLLTKKYVEVQSVDMLVLFQCSHRAVSSTY